MKFIAITIAITIASIVAMTNVVTGTSAGVEMSASDPAMTVLSQSKALDAAQHASTPDGIEFTDSVEKIDQPADAKETLDAMQTKHDDGADGNAITDKQEGFGWGHGGWGSWGGWAGFGTYRFGFRCGGVPEWAYPLSYWNLFGARLYGGGCSLGMPFEGLYYC